MCGGRRGGRRGSVGPGRCLGDVGPAFGVEAERDEREEHDDDPDGGGGEARVEEEHRGQRENRAAERQLPRVEAPPGRSRGGEIERLCKRRARAPEGGGWAAGGDPAPLPGSAKPLRARLARREEASEAAERAPRRGGRGGLTRPAHSGRKLGQPESSSSAAERFVSVYLARRGVGGKRYGVWGGGGGAIEAGR